MKSRAFFYLFTALLIVSCGGDKQSQLTQLKKQRDQLNQRIAALEKELLETDSTYVVETEGKLVGTETLKKSVFNHYIEVQGKLDGDENLAAYPEAMGVVKSVSVKAGDKVSKGQVLAQLNDEAAREQLKSLETNMEFVNELYNKQKALWDQKIGSEVQFLDAKNRKESLESQISSLRKQIEMMKIKAPVDGTVEEVNVKVGQMAVPQFPSFRVVSFNKLKITAEVSEAYSAKVHLGDKVKVFLPDLEAELDAQVDFCSKYINPVNRTFLVEAHFVSQKAGLKANMVAMMRINDYSSSAVVVPINYMRTDQQGKFVLTANQENGKWIARKTYFTEGLIYNGQVEIKEGLKEGQQLITSGFLNIEEGDIIRF